MNKKELFEIGKIVKGCGLAGRMKALSFLESNDTLQSIGEIYIGHGDDSNEPFTLKGVRFQGKSFFLEVEGVATIEEASAFVGCLIFIERDKLKELPEGEYYWRDVIGLKVITEEGNTLGIVESVFPTGSNDVYVVSGGEREVLLPGTADVIRNIDIAQGIMVVRLLEGL
ncbi:MAG TPA: ribosome maturation factor RimM [Syntrophales bacterium]|nr:ribosome maturation factor RimM [Syntrophales bacterium]